MDKQCRMSLTMSLNEFRASHKRKNKIKLHYQSSYPRFPNRSYWAASMLIIFWQFFGFLWIKRNFSVSYPYITKSLTITHFPNTQPLVDHLFFYEFMILNWELCWVRIYNNLNQRQKFQLCQFTNTSKPDNASFDNL